jgi:hypothetical protein
MLRFSLPGPEPRYSKIGVLRQLAYDFYHGKRKLHATPYTLYAGRIINYSLLIIGSPL